ncbi:MAG: hypothetical protein IJW18_01155 [Lachnospiraceae bacterium]|nr:hypothetical protein [Lachnospiraceae bacterium]
MVDQHILLQDIIGEHGKRVQNLKRYYPYFCLSDMSFSQYRDGLFEALDMGYIVMALLRFFIEKNNFLEQYVTYEEYSEFVLALIKRDFNIFPSEADGEELVSYIFDKITNGGKPFVYEYFDPADKKKKSIRVRYFDSHLEEETVVYSVTTEGVEFYLDTKEVKDESAINVSQLLLEKMIKSQNFKGGTDVVRRINNEVGRLNTKRNEVLNLLGTDVFAGVRAFEDFFKTGMRWFADEQKLFDKNKELLEKALLRAKQDNLDALEEIYRLDMELKKAINKHGELLSACMELQKKVDETVGQAKLSRLRSSFDFKDALVRIMNDDRPEVLKVLVEPLLGINVRKMFNFAVIDDMLSYPPERGEEAEKVEKNVEITDYVYEDELEERRINDNFAFLVKRLFDYLKEAGRFSLKEFNGYLEAKTGPELFSNSDYYTFMVHLSQKKEYDVALFMEKPDTFLEGIMAEIMKEADMEEYRDYRFRLNMAEGQETLRLNAVFEITNIEFERSI